MNAVTIVVVRSREQIGRSRERAAKAGLRHALLFFGYIPWLRCGGFPDACEKNFNPDFFSFGDWDREVTITNKL